MTRFARIALGSVLIVLDSFLVFSNQSALVVAVGLILLIPLGILVFRTPRSAGGSSRAKATADRGTRSLIFATIGLLLLPTQFLTFIGIGFVVAAAVYGVLGIRSAQGRRGVLWRSIAGLIIGVVGTALELWWLAEVCSECF